MSAVWYWAYHLKCTACYLLLLTKWSWTSMLRKYVKRFVPVLTSQCCPSQPGKHSHLKRPCCKATHVAPLAHGLPFAVHGFICQNTSQHIHCIQQPFLTFPIRIPKLISCNYSLSLLNIWGTETVTFKTGYNWQCYVMHQPQSHQIRGLA